MSGFEELVVGEEGGRLYVSGTGHSAPGVVIFHPWWGLNQDVLDFADRLAGAGFSVLAPDLVRGRVATTIEEAEQLAAGKDDAHADAVALTTIDRLAKRDVGNRIGVVGFSMGAAWAIWCAAQRPVVAASVVYYGTMAGPSLAAGAAPVLGHFAESDPYESDDALRAFERALQDVGRSVVIHRYAGTGHWFAEPSRDAWRPEAANLAFERTVAFLEGRLDPSRSPR